MTFLKTKRQAILIGLILLLSLISLVVNYYSIRTTSAIRAYLNAESYYSKGQNDATRNLIMYVNSGESRFYDAFLFEIQVPVGDSLARIAMINKEGETIIKKALRAARNHEDDFDDLIWLFNNFQHVPVMQRAIEIWKIADAKVGRLLTIANLIHEGASRGGVTNAEKINNLATVIALNNSLTEDGRAFSRMLGSTARSITNALFLFNLVYVGLVCSAVGVYAFRMINKLKRANHQFQQTLDLANLGSAMINLSTMEITLSPELLQMLDVNQKTPLKLPFHDVVNHFIVEEDRKHFLRIVEKGIRQSTAEFFTEVEVRVKTESNSIKLFHIKGYYFNNEAFGIVHDVTLIRQEKLESIQRAHQIEHIIFSISDGFYALDNDYNFILVNPTFCSIAGVDADTLRGQNIWTIFPMLNATPAYEKFYHAKRTGRTAYFETRSVFNEDIIFQVGVYPHHEGLFVYLRDITKEKQEKEKSEAMLRERDELLHKISANAPGMLYYFYLDANDVGRFPFVSHGSHHLFGLSPDDIVRDASVLFALIHPYDLTPLFESIKKAFYSKAMWRYDFRVILDGQIKWIRGESYPYRENNDAYYWYGYMSDITEIKEAQLALQEREQYLKNILNQLPVPIYITDGNGHVSLYNEASEALWGMVPDTQNESWLNTMQLFDADGRSIRYDASFLTINKHNQRIVRNAEGSYQKPCGERVDFMANVSPLYHNDGKFLGAVNVMVDITERKTMEKAMAESESRFRLIADAAPVMIWLADDTCEFTYFNKTCLDFYGLTLDDTLAGKWYAFVHSDSLEEVEQSINRMKALGPFNATVKMKRSDGEYRWLHYNAIPRVDEVGNFAGYIGTGIDVTETIVMKERLEKKQGVLQDLLNEKDFLIRELHHRVKNNLQLISSMIYLKMGTLPLNVKVALENTRNQIRLIALIHEKLLQANELHNIDISEYLSSLVIDLRKATTNGNISIIITYNISNTIVSIDHAIYYGLIVNELVTNAVKYAFADTDEGTIHIQLTETADGLTLRIQDNGTTLPDDISPATATSFGMQMLDVFVKQLKGKIEIIREQGTCFIITTDLPKEKTLDAPLG